MPSIRLLLLTALLVLAATGCQSGPIGGAKALDLDEVPPALEAATGVNLTASDDRDLAKTVGSMLSVLKTPKIETDQRATAQSILEVGAEELAARSQNAEDLEDLALSDLPSRISVPAGLRGARLLFEDDERSDAYRLIQRVDQRYPSHALRDEAGDLLWEIGESYANDKRRRLFLFPYSNRAPGVFEYLATEYPTHEKSDDALVKLAQIYTKDRLFDVAIEKHRELVLWSPGSPYRIKSEAEIPRLRLADLDGPAYDRDAMLLALSELEAWIASYGNHELRGEVDRTLVDCLQRLADNDLIVARFYSTVKSPEGARQHAVRALEFGKRAGNPEQQEEIRTFLASIDEIERVDAPLILDGGINDAFLGDNGLGITGPAGLSNSLPTQPKRNEPKEEPANEGDASGDAPGGSGEGGNQ
ncbi:hypothetical protein Poly30_18120 [Planctomycetes bacterium Poly30]|uniref:Outer membrane protein assembly factor BamD n=1 Tax=Saltatorellus ferox TaxID=2528018 RepID=A0A518EQE1_9BACT|nr:hypothetical protein Poly30_18120 [Planctomycetes bacterium Poly30]